MKSANSGRSGRRTTTILAATSAALLAVLGPVGPAAIAAPGAGVTAADGGPPQAVIVLMRDQHKDLKPKKQAEARQRAVGADQQSVVSDLRSHGASKISQLTTVSAVAATAKPAEIERLWHDPKVAAVVPDRTILSPFASNTAAHTQPKISPKVCPSNPAKPLLEPEALSLTHTDKAHELATGHGVTVAFLADGVDVENPDFIRPNGTPVFVDYQDFSGDGVHDDSGGGEAFGDASSIAAQGNRVYDLSTELPYAGLPQGCTFRIQGFAPDASLVGIKVFGQFGATESGFVRGIDYAVNHDKVDILSESFGGNPYPDDSLDPVTLANDMAMDAGVTVVASSGDSGIGGTIGSPASDPRAIGVAGTNAYRLSAQAKGYSGWVSNNITGLSSGGPTLNNKLPDLAAPGFGGMAECTVDPSRWGDCSALTQPFGGTSQSAPFVSGAAALVMQAYMQTHHGVRPSPELVKRLLVGTADDLNTPAGEQGAGQLDSYRAVVAARSVRTDDGAGKPSGDEILPSTGQLNLVGSAGTTKHTSITLTNTSNRSQKVAQTSRVLGAKTFQSTKSEQVTGGQVGPSAPIAGPGEGPEAAPSFTFKVPGGTPYFEASMVWPGTRTSGQLVLELFDPKGRLVQESYDYGFSDFQHVDVHDPVAGTWTAKVLWGNGRGHYQEPVPAPGSYRGPISVQITGHKWSTLTGKSSKTIPAGKSATFALSVPLPDQAGDAPASLQFDTDHGTHLSVPVARRALIPAVQNGKFSATITGGVGRVLGQSLGYYIDVPSGKQSMTLDLRAPDLGTNLAYYLSSPDGQILSADTNAYETAWQDSDTATPSKTASLTVNKPAAGRWQLIVSLPGNVSGTVFSEKVTGTVRFNAAHARAVNLPSGATIARGHTVTASIEVTNTGTAPTWFFLDPRHADESTVDLVPTSGDLSIDLPEDTADTSTPSWFVAPHTSSIAETVAGSAPMDVDLFPFSGNPEVFTKADNGNTTVDTATARQLATGDWATDIATVGPFPNGAPHETATVSMAATMQPFDADAHPQGGDVWQQAVGGDAAAPASVVPGVTRNLTLAITPTAPTGTVVHGVVYVDTFNPEAGNGSELIGIPYTYTVG